MSRRVNRNTWKLGAQLVLVVAAAFLMWGCGGGGSSYDTVSTLSTSPLAGQTQNILIDAPTLKSWVDGGYVNNSNAFDKPSVVILNRSGGDFIPGAQYWGTRGIERYDGPILSGNMVLDGATMDALMQEYGITKDTTIVFTDGAQRIYFTFWYWGFPEDQLKILNGGRAAWTAYGYELTAEEPVVEPSTLCVSDLGGVRADLRASLSEAIMGVTDQTLTPYNTYGNTSNVTTPTIKETIRDTSRYVVFQGLMDGGVTDNMVAGLSKTVDINGTPVSVYKDRDEMIAFLTTADDPATADVVEGLGIADLSKPLMPYCRAGNLACNGFAALHSVIGYEVDIMMYDGSWSQWGSLTAYEDVPSPEFALPVGYEAWATDILTDPIYYNFNGTDNLSQPDFYLQGVPYSPYGAGANTIELEDQQYFENTQSSGDAPPTAGGSDSGGGC